MRRALSFLLLCGLGLVLASAQTTTTTTSATTTTAIVVPTVYPTTAADRNAFIGKYQTVAGCVPSATCCCALNTVDITAVAATDNKLNLAGPADGGAGCMGQATLSGSFSMNEPLAAFAYLDFVPVLIQLQTESTHTWLQLNSTRTTCANVFQRVPDLTSVGNAVGGAITNPTGSTINNAVNTTLQQLPSTVTTGLPTSLPTTTATTGSTIPMPNADGSLTLPATTLGSGSSAFTLPAATLPSLSSQSQQQMPAIGGQQQQLPSTSTTGGQASTAVMPGNIPVFQLPNMGAGGAATGIPTGSGGQQQQPSQQQQQQTGFPQFPVGGPFGNQQQMPSQQQQSTGLPTQQQQQQQQQPQIGSAIPPFSTSIPFSSQLPGLGNSGPFNTNSLTAIPLPTGQQTSTTGGGSSSALPQIGGQLPVMGSSSNPFSGAPSLPGQTVGATSTPPTGSTSTPPATSTPGSTTTPPVGSTGLPSTTTTPPTGTPPTGTPPGTGTPFNTAGATTIAGVTFVPLLLELSNTPHAAGTKDYLAAFIVPASADLGVVILHYYSVADMRQKNFYLNKTTSTALATQLVRSAGSALSSSTSYAMYAHAPINMAAADQLTYSYTFARLPNGVGAINTAAYAFPSTAQPNVSAIALPADAAQQFNIAASSNPSTSAVDTSSIWNGQFRVDSTCVPSDSCCCGVGLVNVSTTIANPNEVLLAGMLDGGAGCLYQTSLTGLMAVNATNARRASRAIEIPNNEHTVITFVAELSPSASAAASSASPSLSELTIFNSFRSCQTHASKVAAFTPPADDSTISDPDTTVLLPNSTSANSSLLARDAFVGQWEFDDSCVPSASCCCAEGDLSIAPVFEWTEMPPLPAAMASLASSTAANATAANRSEQIIFNAKLDGGSACVGMSNVSAPFRLVNATAAAFSFPPISLTAALSSSGSSSGAASLDTITFKNSMYPTCASRATKKSGSTPISQPPVSDPTQTPPTTDPTTQPTQTTPLPTTAEFLALRDSIVGEYEPSGCTPSADCCCPSGVTRVSANSTSPRMLDVQTSLAGSGFSCLQKDGDVRMTFTLINATAAEAQPFTGVNVKFNAKINDNEHNTFTITNTVHPGCPALMTRVIRKSGAESNAQAALTLVAVLAAAVAMLAL